MALIEPLLPPWPERSPGPRPVSDRLCPQGILFVLYNDIAWQLLPLELGFGSGQTCWRRLDRWQKAEGSDPLHRDLLAELNTSGELDWFTCVRGRLPHPCEEEGRRHQPVAGRPAVNGQQTPPNLRRARHPAQSHHHCGQRQQRHPDPRSGRRNPACRKPPRPTRRRPEALLGDKGYDSNAQRDELSRRRIMPAISRKGSPNIKGIGKFRYVVEQTFALLHHFKRLAVRWERHTELNDAFVSLACSLICHRRHRKASSKSCCELVGRNPRDKPGWAIPKRIAHRIAFAGRPASPGTRECGNS